MSDKPLVDLQDYTDFVADFVKEKLAQFDMKVMDEATLYIAQDVESYLLDSGKRLGELNEAEKFHLDEFIKERVNDMGAQTDGR